MRRRAHDALTRLGVGHYDLDRPAGAFTIGECQMVEIARLLVRDAKLLILDEPTATLSDAEIANIFAAIRALRAEGRSISYITHRRGEVFNLCDAVSVTRVTQPPPMAGTVIERPSVATKARVIGCSSLETPLD